MLNYSQIIAASAALVVFVDDSYLLAHYHYAKLKYSYDIVAVEKRYTSTGKRIDETSQLITRNTTLWKRYWIDLVFVSLCMEWHTIVDLFWVARMKPNYELF